MPKSLLIAICICLCLPTTLWAVQFPYVITDLGTLGGRFSRGRGINDLGDVTGESDAGANIAQGFVYSQGVMTGIEGVSGGVIAWDINNNREVVGTYNLRAQNQFRAFVYRNQTAVDLGTLPAGTNAEAYSINDLGQIAGGSRSANGSMRAVIFENGTVNAIADAFELAFGINEGGQVVGVRAIPQTSNYAAVIHSGGATATLGFSSSIDSRSSAINKSGQVTGHSIVGPDYHAFLYSAGSRTDLGTLGGIRSEGLGINDLGHVVGYSSRHLATQHAFLYDGSQMRDLNTLIDPASGWELLEAAAINNRGQITGYGTIGGLGHAYLMTPVPEPSTLVIAACSGLALLAGVRRKQGIHKQQTAV